MKILYIDAAVKNESRTRMLADYLASKLDGEIKRVNLEELNLKVEKFQLGLKEKMDITFVVLIETFI